MGIANKPKKRDVERFLGDAGDSPDAGKNDVIKNVQLRLSTKLLKKIDENRRERLLTVSRHTWILESIYEKLGELE